MLAETRQIDLITTGRGNAYRLLLVVETGEWRVPGAKWMLLEKVASYTRYALGGQMAKEDPAAAGAPVHLVLMSDDPLPPDIKVFLGRLTAVLRAEGLLVEVETPEDGTIDGRLGGSQGEPPPATPADMGHPAIRPRPEYPGAESFLMAARFHRWRSRTARPVRRIVLHITDGQADYQRTVRFFQRPTRGLQPAACSVHYVVGRRGEVVQMVRHDDVAWHAGPANTDSIGVMIVARGQGVLGPQDGGLLPEEDQYQAAADLLRWLCDQYRLPLSRDYIVGHEEAEPDTAHKGCPGRAWDWDRLMTLL